MEFTDAHTMYPVNIAFKAATLAEWETVGAESDPEAWAAVNQWYEKYTTLRAARQFCGDGLVLIGPPGTGKTYLACALLNELAAGRYSDAFVTDRNMEPVLRRMAYDENAEAVWDILTRVSCVVWDDFIRFGINEQAAESFLRARHGNGRATIITVNNDIDLSPMLLSFLKTFTKAVFKGEDLRG